MLRVAFISLFPEMVLHAARTSMLQRAESQGIVSFEATDPRTFTHDKHRTVDDKPFGGGPGMLMLAEPIAAAITSLQLTPSAAVVITDPTGEPFTQQVAHDLAGMQELVFLCGHYEGIDERIAQRFATHRLSIGDFVLTGGELPALVMADAVVRLLPGVLGASDSLTIDSHSDGLLSSPQFTRPVEFDGIPVPEVLRSGDHGKVERWKRSEALRATRERRPDLFCRAKLKSTDLDLL